VLDAQSTVSPGKRLGQAVDRWLLLADAGVTNLLPLAVDLGGPVFGFHAEVQSRAFHLATATAFHPGAVLCGPDPGKALGAAVQVEGFVYVHAVKAHGTLFNHGVIGCRGGYVQDFAEKVVKLQDVAVKVV